MIFFSKHYEKLLLGGLLLLFIALLFVFAAQKQVVELQMNEIHKKDYKQVNFMDSRFDINGESFLKVNTVWDPVVLEDGFVKDFTMPVTMSRCPYCDILLPQEYFANGKRCHNPDCGVALVTPVNPWSRSRSDVEVIPQEELYDDDMDGFSYRYEKIAGTDPDDSKDHPPMWHLLSTGEPCRTELGPGLRLVECNEDRVIPENSFAQFEIDDLARPSERKQIQVWIGESVRDRGINIVNGIPCRMTKVVGNDKESDEAAVIASQDRFATLTFSPEDGSESFSVNIYKQAPAYFAEKRIPLHGLAGEDGRAVLEGDIITMGNNLTGMIQYKVVDCIIEYDADFDSEVGKIVLHELTFDGKERDNGDIVVGVNAKVPTSMNVVDEYDSKFYRNGGYGYGMPFDMD